MWGMMTLSQYLNTKNIRQAEFARLIGATQGTVSKLSKDRQPSLDLAAKIERATDGAVPASSWPNIRKLLEAAKELGA
jgi:transcriptional regulator with XRE-family HTH domain